MAIVDYRASIKPKSGSINRILGGNDDANILQPLYETGGLLFPYTPIVNTGGTANYDAYSFTHSNYKQNVFKNSEPNQIMISGEFIAQSDKEARYLLAAITFLRASTKSYFGEQTGPISRNTTADADQIDPGRSGLPPPVLLFNYLGAQMFNRVPVVVTAYTHDLDNSVDYVPVKLNSGSRGTENISYVPTKLTMSVVLETQYNPRKIRQRFDLDQFRRGNMLDQGYI